MCIRDSHLAIKDLFNQYGELARLLERLPDWVDVMILPGNHDAVRPAEPQPALDPEVQQDYSDTVFVGNPCDFSLHGVRVLSYHGKSIDDFVAGLRSVTYSSPELAMRAMMERRHLAPSWGGKTPLSPEPEDRMVISTVPDIFVTGHVHGHYVGNHKGTTMVHSSTWQDQTRLPEDAGVPAQAMHSDGGKPPHPRHGLNPLRLSPETPHRRTGVPKCRAGRYPLPLGLPHP